MHQDVFIYKIAVSNEIWREICTDQAPASRETVQNSSVSGFRFLGDGLFHWTMHDFGLWTRNLPRNDGLNALMMHLFLTNISQDINWWTGVVWITCGLLWCFYQLFGLLFWRHPFTAEIHWWARDVMLHFSKSVLVKKQTHLYVGRPEVE